MDKRLSSQCEKKDETTVGGMQMLLARLPTLIINAVLPFLIYEAMTGMLHQPEFLALVTTSIPPLLSSIVGIIHHRRIDFLSGIILLGIVAGLILTLVSHDARLMLIRESFFTAIFGLTFLISLLFSKPLTYALGRSLVAGDPERLAQYESRWQQQTFRNGMRGQTIILGIGLLTEAAARSFLVFLLPIAQFLVISPFVQWGIIGATIAVLAMYRRRSQLQMDIQA